MAVRVIGNASAPNQLGVVGEEAVPRPGGVSPHGIRRRQPEADEAAARSALAPCMDAVIERAPIVSEQLSPEPLRGRL